MRTETFDRFKWYLLVFVFGGCIGGLGFFLFGSARVQNHFSERIIEREVPVVHETVKRTN